MRVPVERFGCSGMGGGEMIYERYMCGCCAYCGDHDEYVAQEDHTCPGCGESVLRPVVVVPAEEYAALQATVDKLKEDASGEFDRGVIEGKTTQAILDAQGRELFIAELKSEQADDHAEARHAVGWLLKARSEGVLFTESADPDDPTCGEVDRRVFYWRDDGDASVGMGASEGWATRDTKFTSQQATLDTLPKTADGVPVSIGSRLWIRSISGQPLGMRVCSVSRSRIQYCYTSGGGRVQDGYASDWYSTPEAAEAAKEQS